MKNRGKEGFRMFPKPEEPHIAASRYMGRLFKKNVDSHVRYMDRSATGYSSFFFASKLIGIGRTHLVCLRTSVVECLFTTIDLSFHFGK